MQQPVYERARPLMEAELGDELVALDPDGGACFGFNDVAATVWRLLERPSTFAELIEALLSDYDVEPAQCEADVGDLLAQLSDRGLVRLRPPDR